MSCDFFRNSLLSDMSLPKLNFITMVTEGSKLDDDYHYTSTHRLFGKRLRLLFNAEPENTQNVNGRKTVYRLRLNHDKAALKNDMQENCSDSEKHSSFTGGLSSYLLQKSYMAQRQRNCHCGITTVHHRKLTCRGQRCPCFVAGRACFNCRCRGCRNPQKFRSGPTRFQKYRSQSKIMHNMNGIEDQAKTADQALVNSSDD
ncbi:hypothetical protein AVEN_241980-1 [Araneus ventricosus]|uniref:CXC MSL2-type domain-containing protein n=1 Tax=Araneus ventricosus TaxID=182803 RepID=A0A4Y2EBL9_ARAVE|nr:hypothetical protein AVEN_241980-1 [Araneus ventricosus]